MIPNESLFYLAAASDHDNIMQKGIRHTVDAGLRGQIALCLEKDIDARACMLLHTRKRLTETYGVYRVFWRAYRECIRYSPESGLWYVDCQIGPSMFQHVFNTTIECIKSGDIVHLFPAC